MSSFGAWRSDLTGQSEAANCLTRHFTVIFTLKVPGCHHEGRGGALMRLFTQARSNPIPLGGSAFISSSSALTALFQPVILKGGQWKAAAES